MIKPMRAADWDRKKVKFPVIKQPKIDGVRGVNINNVMSARSLKPFGNKHTNLFFSQNVFRGFDGELAAEAATHPRLVSLTSSATSTHEGTPWLMWHIFDYVTSETIALPYIARLMMSADRIHKLESDVPHIAHHLTPIPWKVLRNMNEVDEEIAADIDAGYEGTILRAHDGKYKEGYSSPTQGGLVRIKPFMRVDAIVVKIYEGQRNENEAQENELGHTFRSTHKENMVPNGMVGAMDAVLCEDVVFNGKVLHKAGDMMRVSAGRMTHAERALYFASPNLLMSKRIQVQIFPIGIKDKPRMPTFQSFRTLEDTVEK